MKFYIVQLLTILSIDSIILVKKGFVVFIKLSIVEKDHEIVYVISFHEADKDELMNRPYKEEK